MAQNKQIEEHTHKEYWGTKTLLDYFGRSAQSSRTDRYGPGTIKLIDAIPRNPTGKILKAPLGNA